MAGPALLKTNHREGWATVIRMAFFENQQGTKRTGDALADTAGNPGHGGMAILHNFPLIKFQHSGWCVPRERLLRMLVVGFALLIFTGPAFGYVLFGEHLLDRMSRRLGNGTKGFMVKAVIAAQNRPCDAIMDAGVPETPDTLLQGTAWYGAAGAFRMEIRSGDTDNIYVDHTSGALTIIDGAIRSTKENELLRYKAPLLSQDRDQLISRLTRLGIDTATSSLGRLGDTVAYVVGASYPDESVSQLWLDKESFLPVRLLLVSPRSTRPGLRPIVSQHTAAKPPPATIDIRYRNWAEQDGIRYPMRIEVNENSRVLQVICVTRVERKNSFPDNFFDITTLKAEYPMAEGFGDTGTARPPEISDDDMDNVQQTIEDFKKLYQSTTGE